MAKHVYDKEGRLIETRYFCVNSKIAWALIILVSLIVISKCVAQL